MWNWQPQDGHCLWWLWERINKFMQQEIRIVKWILQGQWQSTSQCQITRGGGTNRGMVLPSLPTCKVPAADSRMQLETEWPWKAIPKPVVRAGAILWEVYWLQNNKIACLYESECYLKLYKSFRSIRQRLLEDVWSEKSQPDSSEEGVRWSVRKWER